MQWLAKKNKRALYEALEKIKSELMLLGFLSLLLTVGQGPISNICISKSVGDTWHPCSKKQEVKFDDDKDDTSSSDGSDRRRLLFISGEASRRVLASENYDTCGAKGKVPLVSFYGIHQLHILIFVLAVFHVLYCVTNLVLGRVKMKKWKIWESETRTDDYQFEHDPERFRFARDTSFGRRHLSFWSGSSISLWIVCFFRQFVRSVPKVDYLTLRHGFIIAHLAPPSHTKFDFQKYINRSLEEDFKFVVGISPTTWFFAVLFLMSNTHGSRSFLWLPFIPLIMILLVGTKLQVIITKMGLKLKERGEVVKGTPLVEPGDHLFWFNNPRLLLYLIHFVLFQNAFQLAFFTWTWYEFGLKSCFHEKLEDVILRISMGVVIQILCSYVTLPLYALVTQMGSTMKPTIFNDRVANALKKWHHTAKKHVKQNKNSTPITSVPGTPLHSVSPVHLLRPYQSEHDVESEHTLPRMSYLDNEGPDSLSHQQDDLTWSNQGKSGHGHKEEISAHESRESNTVNNPDRAANALKKWHHTSKKHLKQNKNSSPITRVPGTPFHSMSPGTPLHSLSPVHLLRHYQSEHDDEHVHTLPRMSYFDNDGPASPAHQQYDLTWSNQGKSGHGQEEEISAHESRESNTVNNPLGGYGSIIQHEIQIQPAEFI